MSVEEGGKQLLSRASDASVTQVCIQMPPRQCGKVQCQTTTTSKQNGLRAIVEKQVHYDPCYAAFLVKFGAALSEWPAL